MVFTSHKSAQLPSIINVTDLENVKMRQSPPASQF